MVKSLVTSNVAFLSERMLRTVTLTGATDAANVGSVVRSSKSAPRSRIASSWSAKVQGRLGARLATFAEESCAAAACEVVAPCVAGAVAPGAGGGAAG